MSEAMAVLLIFLGLVSLAAMDLIGNEVTR